MFLEMFFPHSNDVLGGLVSKMEMAYASLLTEGIAKKAFKYL